MEENTNCDLGMLYEDVTTRGLDKDISDLTSFFKKTKKTQTKSTEHHYLHHSLLMWVFVVWVKKKKKLQKDDMNTTPQISLFNKKAEPSP